MILSRRCNSMADLLLSGPAFRSPAIACLIVAYFSGKMNKELSGGIDMLIWTAKFSRKRAAAAIVLMGVVMAVLIVLVGREIGRASCRERVSS